MVNVTAREDRLLCYIAYKVFEEMSEGRPLTEISVELQMDLLKKDRDALFEITELFQSDWTEEIAQLRAMSKQAPTKHRRSPVIPFPEGPTEPPH
jgi:hypothetical protein